MSGPSTIPADSGTPGDRQTRGSDPAGPPISSSGASTQRKTALDQSDSGRWILADCLGLIIISLIIRAIQLSTMPLWTDELFTVVWSRQPVGFLLGPGMHIETNPPAYYLFMHWWMGLFGDSALAVRLPSLVASVATVVVTYAIAKSLLDRRTALLAGAFAAINPFFVFYGQAARGYALLGLLCALAILALAFSLRDQDSPKVSGASLGQRSNAGSKPALMMLLFIFAAAGAVYIHYTAPVFVLACFFAIGCDLILSRPFPWRRAFRWSVIGILTLVCMSPSLVLAARLASGASISWIPPLSSWTLRLFFVSLAVSPQAVPPNHEHFWQVVLAGATAVLLAVIAFALPRLKFDRPRWIILIVLPLAYLAGLIVLSVHRPVLLAKVAIWVLVPLCIVLARSVLVQPSGWRRLSALLAVLAVWGGALGIYLHAPNKEDWRGAANIAVHDPACSGPVVFSQGYGFGLLYYQPGLASRSLISVQRYAGNEIWEGTSSDLLERMTMRAQTIPPSQLPGFLDNHPRAILVGRSLFSDSIPPEPNPKAHQILNGLIVNCY